MAPIEDPNVASYHRDPDKVLADAEAAFKASGMVTFRVPEVHNPYGLMVDILQAWEPSCPKFSWYFCGAPGVMAFASEADAVAFRLLWDVSRDV